MTLTITATDLIRRSMYLINALAAGEIPDDADLNDALLTLNEMIDGWNVQPLAVYGSANENFTVTPGTATYDWGLTAVAPNVLTERPVWLNNVTCVRNGVSTYVDIITQDEYDAIAIKTTTSPLIERVLYVNAYPLGQLTLFPVPTEAVILSMNTSRQLAGPVLLQSTIAMPPGYLKALRYNLAVDLWPEYTNTTTDIESVKKIARETLGKIKVANAQLTPSYFADIPGIETSRSWDWRAG